MNLEKAIQIATNAHYGQRDKGGKPYILHCLRVMMQMDTEEEMIVAILHDIIEDTNYTLLQLQKDGFSLVVHDSVKKLTKNRNEYYGKYITKIKENQIAKKVKLADLKDNMDITRIYDPQPEDFARILKYAHAYSFLKK